MDNSGEYIEMCRKAYEVQEFKKHYHLGNSVFYNRLDTVCTVVDIDINEGCNLPKVVFIEDGVVGGDWVNDWELRDLIWLPSQDQLQEIIDKTPYSCFLDFSEYIERHTLTININSGEQLWLAFAMEETYSKQWNSKTKEWEKI